MTQATVYDKLLNASPGQHRLEGGKVANLVVNDVDTVLDSFEWNHQVYSSPVILLAFIVLIIWRFGIIGVGISCLIFGYLGLAYVFNRIIINKTKERVALTDIRSARVSEFVQKMRFIKMVGLEPYFERQILKSRAEECSSIGGLFFRRTAFESVFDIFPTFVVIVSLGVQHQIYGTWY